MTRLLDQARRFLAQMFLAWALAAHADDVAETILDVAEADLRADALNDAADYAEFYADERMTLRGDSILHDPILAGGTYTAANLAISADLQIDGTINSAAYHAAKDIAGHLRGMAAATVAP